MGDTSTSVLTVEGLSKSFGDVRAVVDLSFELEPGKVLGLLGHNGAGKTTAIRLILDIHRPDKGRIRILGGPPSEGIKDRIGYMPEERGLYKNMRVEEALVFFGMIRGMKKGEAREATRSWLKRFDLESRRSARIKELSKGMQQKVQFISTVIHRPVLLILDEPFSGLDPVNTQLFEEQLAAMRRDGTAIVFSTHVLEQAERLLDQVIMLRQGEAVVQGDLHQVKRQYGAGWIEVRGEGCAEALEGHRGFQASRQYGRAWRYRLNGTTEPGEVLEHLRNSGATIEKFEILEATLHDIFLYRVGGLEVDTVRHQEEVLT